MNTQKESRAELKEDISSQYPQNVYRAIFGTPVEPESVDEISGMLGDRGALEIAMVLANLSDREAEIIRSRYQKNISYNDLVTIIGVSRERIRQIERKALCKMRKQAVIDLLRMGARAWMNDLVEKEVNHRLEYMIPRRVSEILTERLDWAEQHMMEREAEVMKLARDGDEEQDVKMILGENITVEEMDLSVRAYNCLKRGGVDTVADLISKTELEVRNIRNLGRKCFEEIKHKLAVMGFQMKTEEDAQ